MRLLIRWSLKIIAGSNGRAWEQGYEDHTKPPTACQHGITLGKLLVAASFAVRLTMDAACNQSKIGAREDL